MTRFIIIVIAAVAAISCNTSKTEVAKLLGQEIFFDADFRIINYRRQYSDTEL